MNGLSFREMRASSGSRLLLVLSLLGPSAWAQSPSANSSAVPEGPEPPESLSTVLTRGKVSGGVRSYVMATGNVGELQDWASFGLGASLGWRSGRFAGLGVGFRFYSAAEILGNARELDPTTQRPSRYELGLFDGTNPRSSELALLGEAYLDFERGGHRFWLGRHLLKSPLINPQDGRMIPTLVQGAWYEGQLLPQTTLQLGYLSHIAPRSTSGFYSVSDSIGLYPSGRAMGGEASSYAGNLASAGVFVASLGHRGKVAQAEVWNYFVENVFNTVYLEGGLRPRIGDVSLLVDTQMIAQQRVGLGGGQTSESSYFEARDSLALGARVGAETPRGWSLSLGSNWISSAGRFLFPREWGKEPLFVFQKRERSEGSGDELSWLLEIGKAWPLEEGGRLTTTLGYGQYFRPPVTQSELNKYALPSLFQANLETRVSFGGALRGLSTQFLVVYKGALEEGLSNPAFRLNKVDMMNWNFVANYEF